MAIDISPKAIAIAKEANLVPESRQVRYSVCDIRAIENVLTTASFDLILLLEVIYYLEDDEISTFLSQLLTKVPRAQIVVSAPDSTDYISRNQMQEFFRIHKFRLQCSAVLNTKGDDPWQVIYLFRRNRSYFRLKR